MDSLLIDRIKFSRSFQEAAAEEPAVQTHLLKKLKWESIPPGFQELLELYFLHSVPQTEIASHLGVTQGAVSHSLKKAKKLMAFFSQAPDEPTGFEEWLQSVEEGYHAKKPIFKHWKLYCETMSQTRVGFLTQSTQSEVRGSLVHVHLKAKKTPFREYVSYYWPRPEGIYLQGGKIVKKPNYTKLLKKIKKEKVCEV